MKDDKGHYYYPDPSNKQVRVYVRNGSDSIEFRLWHQDRPEVWEQHEWISIDVIRNAAQMYRDMGRESNPMALYDEAVAQVLLKNG
ncbi:hypothetical protein Dde_0524 [Oleidesulfovibrio alaskensis G20]|jgi:phosphoribosylaminoimidazole-succinocarboxamide synthase|uniref:Uncharacterized protein n=1 Tax=Oleidesulfovibrio alaskensis (strain ATCC BAA-1058 / DSM 17464 / G20) TaxID=207559 RepID=Q315S1_OLEA2|nr:hypothetical protein [Oleidesulfovibrio alaskensis]ABB37325.1 hypothetical protein Dde_0524 [Oleidesulfovibrio alaskensis G20]MBG0773230.1 hypothetical protein [Oleidesulfovibrio alaskensis]MBL3583101.1 hypothetical protein [Oleidesulfovibrio alaskensis]